MDKKIKQELVHGIIAILGTSLSKIILYGSVARGTDNKDSDVDIAVFVSNEWNDDAENKLAAFTTELDIKYNKVFSIVQIKDDEFNIWHKTIPFYKNVEKEGVVLWKAA